MKWNKNNIDIKWLERVCEQAYFEIMRKPDYYGDKQNGYSYAVTTVAGSGSNQPLELKEWLEIDDETIEGDDDYDGLDWALREINDYLDSALSSWKKSLNVPVSVSIGPWEADGSLVVELYIDGYDMADYLEETQQSPRVRPVQRGMSARPRQRLADSVYGVLGEYPGAEALVSKVSSALGYDVVGAFAFCLHLLEDVNAHTEMAEVEKLFENEVQKWG